MKENLKIYTYKMNNGYETYDNTNAYTFGGSLAFQITVREKRE